MGIEEFVPHKHKWVWDDTDGVLKCTFPGCGAEAHGRRHERYL